MEDIWSTIHEWLYDPTIGKFVSVIIGILVIKIIIRIFQHTLLGRIENTDTRYRLRKGLNFLGIIASIILITLVFSKKLGNLTVAFGVAGAGIAFALQEVIASIAGWAAVSMGGFYSVGDRVQLGGIIGDVIDIGMLRTTIMEIGHWVKADQYNGRIVRVANSFVFKEPVYNYSADFPFLWDEIMVPVKYGSDHKLASDLLQKAADDLLGAFVPLAEATWREMIHKFRIEEATLPPMVTLIANDNWLEFTIRYVVDYKKRRSTKDLLFRRILDDFEKTDGRVSIASSTFHLVDAPTFNVRIAGNNSAERIHQ